MSDSDNSAFAGFGKFVPGFDFLQNLATQAAGSAAQKIPQLPNLGSWVAPTLNVEELDKRIDELKAVQFWLDQNAMALKATIQALEVQKMTLATLKGMNFSMGDVANAFKLKVSDSFAGGVQRAAEKAKTFSGFEIPPSSFQSAQAASTADSDAGDDDQNSADQQDEAEAQGTSKKSASTAKTEKSSSPSSAGGVVDPLQWWGALTQQFQSIAADAMKDAAKKAALESGKSMATDMAKDAMKSASSIATGLARGMTGSAAKSVVDGTRAAMNSALRSTQAWPVPAGKTPAAPSRARAAPVRKAAVKSAAKPAARTPAKSASKVARKTLR